MVLVLGYAGRKLGGFAVDPSDQNLPLIEIFDAFEEEVDIAGQRNGGRGERARCGHAGFLIAEDIFHAVVDAVTVGIAGKRRVLACGNVKGGPSCGTISARLCREAKAR